MPQAAPAALRPFGRNTNQGLTQLQRAVLDGRRPDRSGLRPAFDRVAARCRVSYAVAYAAYQNAIATLRRLRVRRMNGAALQPEAERDLVHYQDYLR